MRDTNIFCRHRARHIFHSLADIDHTGSAVRHKFIQRDDWSRMNPHNLAIDAIFGKMNFHRFGVSFKFWGNTSFSKHRFFQQRRIRQFIFMFGVNINLFACGFAAFWFFFFLCFFFWFFFNLFFVFCFFFFNRFFIFHL